MWDVQGRRGKFFRVRHYLELLRFRLPFCTAARKASSDGAVREASNQRPSSALLLMPASWSSKSAGTGVPKRR